MTQPLEAYVNYEIKPGPLRVHSMKVMFGANYFSSQPIVVMRLDLGEYDEVYSNAIPRFFDDLRLLMPSLEQHKCSEGKAGGFFARVQDGTLLGHVAEHVAIELQSLAGMDVAYGKTRSTNTKGVYNVIFHFLDEVAGIYAGKASINLINSILLKQPFRLDETIRALVTIREKRLFGPSTQAIVDEARRRGIPYLRLDEYNLVQIGTGRHAKRVRATITSDTSSLGVDTADNKHLTTLMLKDAGIPVPETLKTDSLDEAIAFAAQRDGPLVVKPASGHLGNGVTENVRIPEQIKRAFQWAKQYDFHVLIQRQIPGHTYRFLVIDDKLVAATRLDPPSIRGDGKSTVGELIQALNREADRGVGDKTQKTFIELDDGSLRILAERGYTVATILADGEELALKRSRKLRSGGSSHDVTDEVHPVNRFLAERAAKVIGLNVAGVDFVAPGVDSSILETDGVVLEVNAAPDFRMHLNPVEGTRRDVAVPVLDMLFPAGTKTRIPIFSVTGTLGKTTTVNLLAHCLRLARHQVGMTTTEGLFIAEKCLIKTNAAYPEHVALVLKDPTIDCAVLETSREGILRRGLGYDVADFGIVLNIHDDHVGSDDINLIEDLAYAKSVVAELVDPDGFSILNADSELVVDMCERVRSNIVLFSRSYLNADVRRHVEKGGMAVVLKEDDVCVLKGRDEIRIMDIRDAPLTHSGKARCNDENILAAVAALYAFGMPPANIRFGLKSFFPDPVRLPGRLNVLQVRDFEVVLDYAHNKQSFLALKDFLSHFQERKVGVFDSAGDRSDDDIMQLGRIAAQMFDEGVVYEGVHRRGRKEGEIVGLLKRGLLEEGFAADRVTVHLDPDEAWKDGLARGKPGTLVVIISGRVDGTLKAIESFRAQA